MLFSHVDSSRSEDRYLLKKMNAFYSDSLSINQSYWEEASLDTRFEVGDQVLWNELYSNVPPAKRRFFFNRIRPIVNMVSGWQRRNRKSTIVTPVENGDQETADQFTKILMWCARNEGILETISDSFHGALVSGLNLLQLWIDYRTDPISGTIKVDCCPFNSFLIDPFFKKRDLSDCNGLWKRSYISRQECKSLLPDHAELIDEIPLDYKNDGKFNYLPESYNIGPKNLLVYDEFWYRDYRRQRLLVDARTSHQFEWKSDNDENLQEFLTLFPQVKLVEHYIPTVNLAIVVQGRVMYNGPNPIGIDKYPFVPIFCYFNPQSPDLPWRIQGMVRGLRDTQFLYNRRKMIEFDTLESNATNPIVYKVDSLVDPEKELFQTGQGRVIGLKKNASMDDIQFVQAKGIDPTILQISSSLGNEELYKISGANEELMGAAIDDKAAILSMLRQGAGLTTLQPILDGLDFAQKQLGNLMIDTIQSNFTASKVARILGEDPTQEFYNKAFGRYDAAVEEGLNTTTQKQLQFAQLMQLKDAGVAIPDEFILENVTVQNKKDLVDTVKASREEESRLKQMQIEAELEDLRSRSELSQARAVADKGLGLERASRIQENEAFAIERRAEARKDSALGLVNIVKAIKELDDIDLSQLERLAALSQLLNQQNKVDEVEAERSKAGNVERASQRLSAA